jgi:hypothetical protein
MQYLTLTINSWWSFCSKKKSQAEEAKEAKRLRKRKKAEALRLLDMEKRQKQRVEEVRETQRKVFFLLILCNELILALISLVSISLSWLFSLSEISSYLLFPFLCWKDWRRYTAEGAVSRGSKIGARKFGKDMQRCVFDFACIRHPCWRGRGMLYIYWYTQPFLNFLLAEDYLLLLS